MEKQIRLLGKTVKVNVIHLQSIILYTNNFKRWIVSCKKKNYKKCNLILFIMCVCVCVSLPVSHLSNIFILGIMKGRAEKKFKFYARLTITKTITIGKKKFLTTKLRLWYYRSIRSFPIFCATIFFTFTSSNSFQTGCRCLAPFITFVVKLA